MIKIIIGIVICIILLTFVGSLLFIIIGLPIWAIIDCAVSKERSNGSKVFWIIFSFLTWMLGALIYGLFVSTRKSLRWMCITTSMVVIIFVIGWMGLLYWASSNLTQEINRAIVRLQTVDTTDLKTEDIETLKKDLAALSKETRFDFNKRRQMFITSSLLEYYQLIVKDNKISNREYMHWRHIFELRKTLNEEAIQKIIKQKGLQLKVIRLY